MKLTRNKIRKIRKQQHQSVRKWKKARNSIRRKVATFRRSPLELIPKRKNVFNKTLKKYIPLPVLEYLKEKYLNMRKMRRKQRRERLMIGGAGADEAADAAATATAIAAVAMSEAEAEANAAVNNGPGPTYGPADALTADAPAVDDPAKATATDDKTSSTSASPTAAPGDDKKKTTLNLGPDVPGDISIRSISYELKNANETYHLVNFLLDNGLPYYIQMELKTGTPFSKNDTDIFDLRRILYGKFMPKAEYDKIPSETSKEIYFTEDKPLIIGIADGDTMQNEYPNDVFIFTKEKGELDKESKKNAIKIKIGTGTGPGPNTPKSEIVVTDSKRLYTLNGESPASIDNKDDLLKLRGNPIDTSEFRVQVAPLSDADFKSAVATSSGDGDKKKKKVIADDTNSYVVNLSVGCKVTSIQTLRKSLEAVRASLEDKDDVIKTTALDIFKLLTSILEDPEMAKNEGFDDFKESIFGFTYKIPGTERKYGFAQMISFFEQEKGETPKTLEEEFFKLLTLLGHGPAGENGACLSFGRPTNVEIDKYVTTLMNGDVITTEKLGSPTNMDQLGIQLNKLNPSSSEEEDAKKSGGPEAKDSAGAGAEATDGAGAEATDGAAAGAEGAAGADAKEAAAGAEGAEGTEGTEGAEAKEAAAAGAEGDKGAEAKEGAAAEATAEKLTETEMKQQADAEAEAIATVAIATSSVLPPNHITPESIPVKPLPPSQEVIAINKLYENYDKKKKKIGKILNLRKFFERRLKEMIALLLDIFKKSNESYEKNGSKSNTYIKDPEYKKSMDTLTSFVKSFKKSDEYKYVKDKDTYCDKIVSEFIPHWYSGSEKRELAKKICTLFKNYVHYTEKFNESYEYFNNHKNMKPVIGAILWGSTKEDIESSFTNSINNLEKYMNALGQEELYTKELEKQLRPETAQQTTV